MRRALGLVLALFVSTAAHAGQGGPGRAGALPPEGAVSPAEVQRMFDAYALMQAQDQLQIADDKFSQFLTRYKALQDARRRTLRERSQIIGELRRMLNQPQPPGGIETQLRDQLKALQDVESRGAADERRAYEAIDQVLDLRQQAKFRVFEEVMERRKLELVARARLANRPRNQK